MWLLAAVFFFVPSALAVASLSARFPEEGGIYVWTRRGFGDWHGFLCGWCYWLSNLFYLPNLLLAGVGMAGSALGLAENKAYIMAASLIILWTVLLAHLSGLEIAKWTSNAGGMATYAAGVLIIVLGMLVWLRRGSATPIPLAPTFDFQKLNFWSQIAFAFGGLELGAVLGGEIRDPRREVPRAAWISGLAIAAFYILGTLALLALLKPAGVNIMTGLIQAAQAAGAELGSSWVVLVLTGLILMGVAGQLGAWLGGSARIPFVIGVDRYLPEAFAKLHPRRQTPHVAILVQGVSCTVFLLALEAGETLSAGYQLLVDMTVITYFIPFLYLFAAAWKAGRASRAAYFCGLVVTVLAIGLSLVPPPEVSSVWVFELKVAGGCAVLIGSARVFFVSAARRRRSTTVT